MSAPLDHYYTSADAGVALAKPRPKISPLFASILTELERSGNPGWSEIGVALSMYSPDDQAKIASMLAAREKRLRKKRKTAARHDILIRIPSKASSYALVCVMFENETADQMRELMQHAAMTAFRTRHVRSVVVIGRDIDRPSAAYRAIALLHAPPTPDSEIEHH